MKSTYRSGSRRQTLQIVSVLSSHEKNEQRGLDGLLITDIGTAQEILGKVGALDRIDLIVSDGIQGKAALERITTILPPVHGLKNRRTRLWRR